MYRMFGISSDSLEGELIGSLDKEYAFERENYSEVTEKAEFLKTKGFELTETPNGIDMLLTREFDTKTVEITFKAKQTNEEEDIDDYNDDDDEEHAVYTDFTVYIHEDNKGLVYECSCSDTEVSISNVYLTNDVISHKKIPSIERGDYLYLGPDYASLSSNVQNGLAGYLIDAGLDQQTVAFIEVMSLDKEQRLYLNWIQGLKTFVEDKIVQ